MHIGLGVARSGDLLETGLAISAELIELREVLRGVLIVLEEARGVVIDISIAEVVNQIAQGVLYILLELGRVLGSVDIKLACGGFQTVGLRC